MNVMTVFKITQRLRLQVADQYIALFAYGNIGIMKKLFLASSGLDYIKEFVTHDPSTIKTLFIPTAGNLDDDIWWIEKDRDVLSKMGFQMTELDIEKSNQEEMKQSLAAADIVYVAGGNTFHLLKILRNSGFDTLLTDYVNGGGLYAGASAGALIAGVDIEPISSIDEPEKVTGLSSTKGLNLIDIVPIPHYDMQSRTNSIDEIKRKYDDEYEIVLLTDDQAIVVEDDNWRIVDSLRSPLEREWFNRNHM